jgi:PD-(D/E)XK nuclease superfamily
MKTIPIESTTLYDLEQWFGLQIVSDYDLDWQKDLPALTKTEQTRLLRIQASYANLERRAMLENTVQLAVISPLLDLAGFFLPPFYVDTETAVNIDLPNEEVQLRGKIDILVLQAQLWILIIESKRAELSLKVGIPQALSYMLAAPATNHALFGLVTNGNSFVFLQLHRQPEPRYSKSKELIVDRDDDLATALQILKKIGALIG